MRIKVLSYNIHKGFDWGNRNYYLKHIREFIIASRADLVFLQEVVGKNKKIKKRGLVDAQFEYLANGIWHHYSYARNAVYNHGHHGNLILSKYPIESVENLDLSTNRLEQRGMLVCKIATGNKVFYAGCLHLNLLHSGRRTQYKKIREYLNAHFGDSNMPLIIGGDFNDWNKKSSLYFERRLGMQEAFKKMNGSYARTFPANFPLLSLDRIYVRNFQVISSKVLLQENNIFSDHLPLFCEVELNEK